MCHETWLNRHSKRGLHCAHVLSTVSNCFVRGQATAKWLKMKKDSADPGIMFPPTDNEGPENSPFRLWVKTKTKLNFQEAEEKAKTFTVKEKEQKDMSQAEIDATHKRLMMDHQASAGASAAATRTPEEIARHLASSGHGGGTSSGAFQGRGVEIGNVEELVDSEEEDGNEDDAELEDSKGDSAEPVDAAAGGKRKSASWFDWDKAVGSFIRAEENALATLKDTVMLSMANMESIIKQVSSEKYAALKPLLSLEFDLCRKRCDFLGLVLSQKPSAKEDLKALPHNKCNYVLVFETL